MGGSLKYIIDLQSNGYNHIKNIIH